MSNRFLTNQINGSDLASETTQLQIRDVLLDGTIDISGNIDIDLSDMTITDISFNNGIQTSNVKTEVLNDVSCNIINDLSCNILNTVNTNLTQLNGNTISTNIAAVDNGTIRIVGPSGYDFNVSVNSLLSGSHIPINLSQLKGNVIDTGIGVTGPNSTQRVVLASDQPILDISANEILIKIQETNDEISVLNNAVNDNLLKYNRNHVSFNTNSTNINNNYVISANSDAMGLSSISSYFQDNISQAQITAQIISSSANDSLGQTGARIVQIKYYTTNDISSLQTVNVNMNGINRVNISTIFFRLKSATVIVAGTSNHNEGNLYIFKSTAVGGLIPANEIISVIPATYNINNYGYVYIPYDPSHRYIKFDYLNIAVSSDNASDDHISVISTYVPFNGFKTLQLKLLDNHYFRADSNLSSTVDLSHLIVDSNISAVNHGIDLLFTYTNDSAADFACQVSLGYYYSNHLH